MPKKLILVFAIVMFFLEYSFALADVVINEFVSDPDSGSEWIELFNDSSAEVSLSDWSWTDLASPGGETEHESSPRSLSGTVSAAGFFVLEMNNVLNNSGDSIGLYNGASLIDRVTFGSVDGYSQDLALPAKGKSGALISGNWQTNQESTKGAVNPFSNSSDDNNNDDDNSSDSSSGSDSSSTSSSTETAIKTSSKIKTEITVRDIAYVGIPLAFQGRMTQDGRAMSHGRYFWNFGDGDFREVKVINIDKFTHTYYYPGEYTVIFEYYPDHFADMPDASEKINIKVIEPQISISRVGDAGDFFVELANNTSYEVDISGWLLSSNSRSFTVPKNTIIGANKKMIISGRTSGLTIYDLAGLKLLTPQNGVAFVYSPYSAPQASRTVTTVKKNAPETTARAAMPDPGENLLAAANEAEVDSHLPWPVYLISVLFISASAFAVYFIRRKKTSSPGSDFEILDE